MKRTLFVFMAVGFWAGTTAMAQQIEDSNPGQSPAKVTNEQLDNGPYQPDETQGAENSTGSGFAILDKDQCVDKEVFEKEWIKYSDIDDRIPVGERSWDAQQYAENGIDIRGYNEEIAYLSALMETDRQKRLQMKDFQNALSQGIKKNLVKAFCRLVYVTYDALDTAKSGGEAGGELIVGAAGSKVMKLKDVAGAVKDLIPEQHKGSGDWIKDEIQKMDKNNPQSYKDLSRLMTARIDQEEEKKWNILPDTDITEEDMDLLTHQRELNDTIKQAIADSYSVNQQRADQIEGLKAKITTATQEQQEWLEKEKARVYAKLNDHCKHAKHDSSDTGDINTIINMMGVIQSTGFGHPAKTQCTPSSTCPDGH